MIPERKTVAELGQMTRQETIAYFEGGGDLTDVGRHARRETADLGPRPGELRHVDEVFPMVSVRVSPDVVRRLDVLAGRDRAGRSGVIRAALDEYLARHFASQSA